MLLLATMDDIFAKRVNTGAAEIVSSNFDLSDILPSRNVKPTGNEVQRTCPLCKSLVRYFFVNLNEKVLMCENRDCEFPFGYEDLEFVKQDEQCDIDEELESITTIMAPPVTSGSMISTNAWSDIDKLNKAYESEDSQAEFNLNKNETTEEKQAKIDEFLKEKETELQTKKNIQQIKKLNAELQNVYDEDNVSCIKNEKWIKHLMALQNLSGVQLLKKTEMLRIKKADAVLGASELTIGFDRGQNMSSITIGLCNKSDMSTSESI